MCQEYFDRLLNCICLLHKPDWTIDMAGLFLYATHKFFIIIIDFQDLVPLVSYQISALFYLGTIICSSLQIFYSDHFREEKCFQTAFDWRKLKLLKTQHEFQIDCKAGHQRSEWTLDPSEKPDNFAMFAYWPFIMHACNKRNWPNWNLYCGTHLFKR